MTRDVNPFRMAAPPTRSGGQEPGTVPAPPPLPPRRPPSPRGPVADAVQADLTRLIRSGTPEPDIEPSLRATAMRLAEEIDCSGGDAGVRVLAALTRELRATLEMIAAMRRDAEPPGGGADAEPDLRTPE